MGNLVAGGTILGPSAPWLGKNVPATDLGGDGGECESVSTIGVSRPNAQLLVYSTEWEECEKLPDFSHGRES